jgi:hypothetical protein
MDFRCPSCQKDITVPDEYAGQLMKCPLCEKPFQAPALPPPISAAPLEPTAAYSIPAEPPPPAPEARGRAEETKPPAAPPPGDYAHGATLWISPRVVPWITPVALFLVFVLLFFNWMHWPAGIRLSEAGDELTLKTDTISRNSWGLGFGEINALTILYLLTFLPTFLLAVAVAVVQLLPGPIKLPGPLPQLWPWRSALVALMALLSFFFLMLQLLAGFKVKTDSPEALAPFLQWSLWLELTVLFHFTALVAALLDFWLEVRGPGRPTPRIDVRW